MTLRHSRAFVALPLLLVLPVLLALCFVLADAVPLARAAPPRQSDTTGGPMSVRWGFYITYNPNSWTSLQANARYLNYVSPWFYNLNPAGQVTGKDRPEVSALLKSVGAKSLPMLKNTPEYNDLTAILTDTNKQASIINQVDNLIAANGYDGITIDFEAVNAADKALLTGFMSRLADRLHQKGKLVAIAVGPKVKEITAGWAAAYDYPALAQVVDYILIMAYDYHWVNSGPGPIAPIGKLRDTADYTAARVPPSKVIWGVGVYGYDWGKGTAPGASDGKPAEYRNFGEAQAIASLAGAQSGYDEDVQSPWVEYTRDNQPREIWYENGRSFAAKTRLIREYGFAGFGLWRLGQEDPAVWPAIQQEGEPFACQPIAEPPASPDRVYFDKTGHTLGGTFLKYWRDHGGLPVYGYPLTEEFTERSPTDGKQYKVQYFERNRFEYHPENKAPNNVLLGLLGVQATSGRVFPEADPAASGADTVYFPQVRHSLASSFLTYWQSHGGIAQFGYPISEPVLEQNPSDGKTYTVQYLERARFELHSEYAGTDAEVLLGLLGYNVLPCSR